MRSKGKAWEALLPGPPSHSSMFAHIWFVTKLLFSQSPNSAFKWASQELPSHFLFRDYQWGRSSTGPSQTRRGQGTFKNSRHFQKLWSVSPFRRHLTSRISPGMCFPPSFFLSHSFVHFSNKTSLSTKDPQLLLFLFLD